MKRFNLLSLIFVLALASCGTFEIGLEPVTKATPTNPAATSVVAVQIPTENVTSTLAVPSLATQVSEPTQNLPSATSAPQMVKLFLIALEDNGKAGSMVGCGDSVVSVQTQIQPTQGVLKAAVETLLANKSQNYGESGLYNALYQSDLHLDKATIVDGEASVDLSGKLQLGGECDNPRVQAQLEQTILQFSTVKKAAITLNGKPLSEALSLK
jgi:hypothetical protein